MLREFTISESNPDLGHFVLAPTRAGKVPIQTMSIAAGWGSFAVYVYLLSLMLLLLWDVRLLLFCYYVIAVVIQRRL